MFIKRSLSYSLVVLLALQPAIVSAGVVVDSNAAAANQAAITQAANGVEIVNIAPPSAKGVSHNKFTELDIAQQGLIFNNAQQQVNTGLAGAIASNPHLTGGSANIILNEVTSANRSLLEGYAEIAGQSADFILANPNGITCNGCGFINTPRATLTTGIPNLLDGGLVGFTVNGGDIAIDSLNASSIDRLDILTRAISLNAELRAQELNLVAGRNSVNYSDLAATALIDDGSPKPTFALDVAALGGMYANSIKLIGTEAGVGVNVSGEMATNSGNIQLSADGHILLNKLVSGGDLSVESSGDSITLTGSAYAAGDTHFQADSDITLNGLLSSKNDIQLIANTLTNTDSAVAGRHLNANAATIINQGVLGAGADLTLTASQKILNGDEDHSALLFAAENMRLYSDEVINRYADIVSLGDLLVAKNLLGEQASLFYNGSGVIESFGNITIKADQVVNRRDPIGGVYAAVDEAINNDDFCQNSRHNYYCNWRIRGGEQFGVLPDLVTEREVWLLQEYMAADEIRFNGNPDDDHLYVQERDKLQALFRLGLRPSEIYAGGDITINASVVSNEGGTLSAAGDLLVNTGWFHNITRMSLDTGLGGGLDKYTGDYEGDDDFDDPDLDDPDNDNPNNADPLADLDPASVALIQLYNSYTQGGSMEGNPYLFYPALLEAGGTITINASEGINNGVPPSQPEVRAGRPLPEVVAKTVSANSPETISPDFALESADPFDPFLNLPDLGDFQKVDVVLPPTNSRLFTQGSGTTLFATHESIAQFIDVQGSDYLLDLLGFDPDQTVKRLGDGFYESRLIRQAITQATGSRFLHAAFRSDAEQLRYLMQSAYRAQQALNLTLGVTLTKEQIASLTHDMVWMEEKVINGQRVLVPQLYLASVRPGQLDVAGNLMVANSVALNSEGGIGNYAGIAAKNHLSLDAKGQLENAGQLTSRGDTRVDAGALINTGSVAAVGDVSVTTQQDLVNQGGLITGQTIDLTSEQGSIRNLQSAGSLANHLGSYQGQRGAIVAKGDLSLIAKKDIENKGSDIQVGGNLNADAKRDIKLTASQHRYGINNENVIHTGSSLRVDGNAALSAGRDLKLHGSELTIAGDADVNVGRDLEVASVENRKTTYDREFIKYKKPKREGGFLNKNSVAVNPHLFGDVRLKEDTTIVTETETVTQQRSQLAVGGNFNLNTGNRADIVASDIKVAGKATADIGGELTLTAKNDMAYVTRTETKTPIKKTRDGGSMVEFGAVAPTEAAIKSAFEPKSQKMWAGDFRKKRSTAPKVTKTSNVLATQHASIQSGDDLTVVAERDIANRGGSEVISEESLSLISEQGGIENSGGSLIKAGDVYLQAKKDVINQRTVKRTEKRGSGSHQITTDISAKSVIESSRDVVIKAGEDIRVLGSEISANDDIYAQADGRIIIDTVKDHELDHTWSSDEETRIETITNHASKVQAGNDVVATSQKDLTLAGSLIKAGNNALLISNGETEIKSRKDEYHYYHYEEDDGGLFGGGGSETEQHDVITNKAAVVQAGNDITVVSEGNLVLKASKTKSGEDTTLVSKRGVVALLSDKDIDNYTYEADSSSAVWQSAEGEGRIKETVKHTEIDSQGELRISAAQGVFADYHQKEGETFQQSIQRLSEGKPELAWMQQLAQRDDVDWNAVQEAHEQWDYESAGLTGAGAAIVTLAVTIATGGAGAALASGIAATATQAAITSLATQASLSLINNQGNIGAVFKELGSSDAVKNIAIAAASAGLNQGIAGSDFMQGMQLEAGSWQQVMADASSRALVDTALYGGSLDENLQKMLLRTAVNAGAAQVANQIGNVGAIKDLDNGGITKTLLHASAGCVAAEAGGGNCGAGALGGATAELISPWLDANGFTEDTNAHLLDGIAQLAGSAAGYDGASLNDVTRAASITDRFNRQLHNKEIEWIENNAEAFVKQYGGDLSTAKARLAQAGFSQVDFLGSLLLNNKDAEALAFIKDTGATFINEKGEAQELFTTQGDQYRNLHQYASSAYGSNLEFYKQHIQPGIQLTPLQGAEIKTSDMLELIGRATQSKLQEWADNPDQLATDYINYAKAVGTAAGEIISNASLEGIVDGVVDGTKNLGGRIGEGAAVALDDTVGNQLNALYGQDVSGVSGALLAADVVTGVGEAVGAGKVASLAGDLTGAAAKKVGSSIKKKKDGGRDNSYSGNNDTVITDGEMDEVPDRDVISSSGAGEKSGTVLVAGDGPNSNSSVFPLKFNNSGGIKVWESPAGLKYGPDPSPNFGNRIQHVLNHAEDLPNRPGKHGVFDSRKEALHFTDEAWKKVLNGDSSVIRTTNPARGRAPARDVYLVPMNQRTGYVGGQWGNANGLPEATHLRLVIENGNNVVSSFPVIP